MRLVIVSAIAAGALAASSLAASVHAAPVSITAQQSTDTLMSGADCEWGTEPPGVIPVVENPLGLRRRARCRDGALHGND